MNKWRFTFCKYNCFPFHYVYLMQGFYHILLDICKYLMIQSSIWQMVCIRTSEDPHPRHPWGIHRMWAWSSPTWWHPTSTTSPARQPGATTGHSKWLDEEASGEQRESFIFIFSSSSLASLCWCDWPLGCGQLAPHHGVQVWVTSLYRVS
jgi:hypothetical protein